jgi:hypothetical protein
VVEEPVAAEPEPVVEEPAAEEPAVVEDTVEDRAARGAEDVTEPEAPAPSPDVPPAAETPPASADAGEEETMPWFGRARQPTEHAEPSGPTEHVDEGADEIEVIGAATPRPEPAPMPGSRELDDALAALDSAGQPAPEASPGTADQEWPPSVDSDLSELSTDVEVTAFDAPPPGAAGGPSAGLLPSVRPQTTSASRAYRRLRRIFPG